MLRALALLGGFGGAVALSQGPAFSQQYLQRLGGQADALNAVLAEFDASATAAGLTRDAALAELTGSAFLDRHGADMTRAIARAERVNADLTLLRAATPLERIAMPHRFRDAETLQATWADFRPAVPVTSDGLIAGAVGFALGWVLASALLSALAWPFRRRVWA